MMFHNNFNCAFIFINSNNFTVVVLCIVQFVDVLEIQIENNISLCKNICRTETVYFFRNYLPQ